MNQPLLGKDFERLTRSTHRQVQCWRDAGILHPQAISRVGQGGLCYSYSVDDALRALIMIDLRKKGISTQVCRRILKQPVPVDAEYLLVARRSIEWCKSVPEVVERFKASAIGYVTIPIGQFRARILSTGGRGVEGAAVTLPSGQARGGSVGHAHP